MQRAIVVAVCCSALGLGLLVGSGTAGAAPAPAVTGCTAVTPADLQTVFGVPFTAGVSAGPAFLPGDCKFATDLGQPPATALYGLVSVSVVPGKKPGAKAYSTSLKAPGLTRTQVLNVGTAAVSAPNSGGKEGCPESAGYRVNAKNAKGAVFVTGELVGVVVPPSLCGRNGVTAAQMAAVANVALNKL